MNKPHQWSKMTYMDACRWAAFNDQPAVVDRSLVLNFTATLLIADIFARPATEVAKDICRIKHYEAQGMYQTQTKPISRKAKKL